jgi:putative membrane protein
MVRPPVAEVDTVTFVESLAWLPSYVAYLGVSLLLMTAVLALYTVLTPHSELRLARNGNPAAAASFTGALLGFAWPLANAVAGSTSLLDLLIWTSLVLLVQLAAVLAVSRMLRTLSDEVRSGQLASGVLLGAIAVALGLLNAAALPR